jgi:hypothetical protein
VLLPTDLTSPKKGGCIWRALRLVNPKWFANRFLDCFTLLFTVGFVVINIELLEIVIDGFLGTHRVFAPFLGRFYDVLIATFEVFAALVLVSVVLFWTRRNVMRIKRFWSC